MPFFGAAPVEGNETELTISNQSQTRAPRSWLKRNKGVILIILLSIAVLFVFLFWYLEGFHPLKNLMPSTTSSPAPLVKSYTLHPHDGIHRKGYSENTYLKLLNNTHAILNVSNCWVCSHLPHHGNSGLQWHIYPFPLVTACYASFRALFFGKWNSSSHGNFDGTDINRYDMEVLLPLGCSVLANKSQYHNASTQKDKVEIPFLSLVTFKMTKIQNNPSFPPAYMLDNIPETVPFCMIGLGTVQMGNASGCVNTTVLANNSGPLYVGDSVYFACGSNAYPWLPYNWGGVCYIGVLLPGFYVIDSSELIKKRPRRDSGQTGDTGWQVVGDLAKAFVPWYGPTVNSRDIRHLARTLERTANETTDILTNMTLEQKAIRLVALQNRMVLDMMLVEKGGVCSVVGSASCCVFVPDYSKNIFEGIDRIHTLAASVHVDSGGWDIWGSVVSAFKTWGWKILSAVMCVVAVIVMFCLCIHCLPAILVACCNVCAHLGKSIKPRPTSVHESNAVIMMEREIVEIMEINVGNDVIRENGGGGHSTYTGLMFEDYEVDLLYTSMHRPDPEVPISSVDDETYETLENV